ncbi:MAG: 8-amino-7-oxononanoate synthase [Pseudomonas sp.]|nr:8-amino-7-oxononanoate synthase [Pseudomonas sp.]
MSWNDRIERALQHRRDKHLWRQRHTLDSAQGTHVRCDGHTFLNFCSNDYLGLAATGQQDLSQAAERWAIGSGASHLVCGHSRAHHDLEQALADYTGYPRALLFSTGYMANVGVISALAQRGDQILQDKLNHASLLDGAQLSRARMTRYRHADLAHLNDLLERFAPVCKTDGANTEPPQREGTETDLQADTSKAETLVVTDSIFSMDGDLANIAAMATSCQQHQALLMVDDAHGLGILGPQGRGVRAHFDLSCEQLPVYIGTLGKAFGGYGAFVAGSEDLIDYLIQFARSYIYTTAMPPALADAMLGNLQRLQDDSLRNTLHQRIAQFRRGAQEIGLPLMASESPIQPILVGNSQQALALSQALRESGIWVSAIRPPTVPVNEARLRVTLTAAHSEADVTQLLQALEQHWQALTTAKPATQPHPEAP